MTLLLFKYGLPALLGYTLFVGISGRLNPFQKPWCLEERPAWLLGLWTGLTVLLVLGTGMHMAYDMPLEAARLMLTPSLMLLAGMLVPGFIAHYLYRRDVQKTLRSQSSFESALLNEILDERANFDTALVNEAPIDRPDHTPLPESANQNFGGNKVDTSPVVATFLDTASVGNVDASPAGSAINDASQQPPVDASDAQSTAADSAQQQISALQKQLAKEIQTREQT